MLCCEQGFVPIWALPGLSALARRGLISSLLVAGFTGCGVIFYLLDLIFQAVGADRCEA